MGAFDKNSAKEIARKLNVDWEGREHSHVDEWRRYVGPQTRAIWSMFTFEQRVALVSDAQDFADEEAGKDRDYT